MADLKDILRLFRKLSKDEIKHIEELKKFIDESDLKTISMLLKQKKISIIIKDMVSKGINENNQYLILDHPS